MGGVRGGLLAIGFVMEVRLSECRCGEVHDVAVGDE